MADPHSDPWATWMDMQSNRMRVEDFPKLARDIGDIEAEHDLPAIDGFVHPTVPFLEAVAAKLRDNGVRCTVTGAWQAWVIVTTWRAGVRTETQEDAELAFWYGLNPFELTQRQREGLIANLPRMLAQDRLHNGNFDPLDYRGVYDLVLVATGDLKQAQAAQADALQRYVDSETRFD